MPQSNMQVVRDSNWKLHTCASAGSSYASPKMVTRASLRPSQPGICTTSEQRGSSLKLLLCMDNEDRQNTGEPAPSAAKSMSIPKG